MKRRTVFTSPAARADLHHIYASIADAGSPTNALRFVERIADFCERMDIVSERGALRSDVRPGLRAIGFERRVTITFNVDDDRVTILRIFYGGRNWEDDFR